MIKIEKNKIEIVIWRVSFWLFEKVFCRGDFVFKWSEICEMLWFITSDYELGWRVMVLKM